MAAKDLESIDIKKQKEIEDITTCCICNDVYTDPKALPCIHTFCMKCLRDTGLHSYKGPGDEMPCPVCRRLFKVPQEGFHGLPKNILIERLIVVAKCTDASEASRALCSVCLGESKEQDGKETPTADSYCTDCKHKLCKGCYSDHKKFKLTKNHRLMPITEYESSQNLAPGVCEVHKQKILDVYCVDCKTVVCSTCFIEEHKNHEGSDINKCVDDFRKQIQNNTKATNECIAQAQKKKAELAIMKEQMHQLVGSLECGVNNRKGQIMQLADKHTSHLLQGLCYERQRRLTEIQMASDEIDAYLSNLESYNSNCRRIIAKGSASDVCSALSNLSGRAFQLQQQCRPIIERGIHEFKICFRQSELEEFLADDCDNLVGEIEKEGDLKPKKRSKKILLAEQSKEIGILRQENAELRKEKANCNAHLERLKQEQEKTKTAIIALQTNNEKLKQELKAEKTTSNSLQTSTDRFVEELHMYEADVKSVETNAEKIREVKTKAVKPQYAYRGGMMCHQLIEGINGSFMKT